MEGDRIAFNFLYFKLIAVVLRLPFKYIGSAWILNQEYFIKNKLQLAKSFNIFN